MLSGCAASRGQPTGLEDADIDGGSGNGRAPFNVKWIVKVTFPKLPTWKQASETLGKNEKVSTPFLEIFIFYRSFFHPTLPPMASA